MWLYYLCLNLHIPHPDYLHHYMTEEQISGWARFYNHWNFGQTRTDQQFAELKMICTQNPKAKWNDFKPISPFEIMNNRRQQSLDEQAREILEARKLAINNQRILREKTTNG